MKRNNYERKALTKAALIKTLFLVFSFFVLLAVFGGFIFKTSAYFSDNTSGTSIITTGNVKLTTAVYDETNTNQLASDEIQDLTLVPGNWSMNYVRATNSGSTACYVRIACLFEVKYASSAQYVVVNNVANLVVTDSTNFVKNADDKCVYYKQSLATSSLVNIPIKVAISDDLGLDTSVFENATYRITITIQAIQTLSVTLDAVNGGWTDGSGNPISL